MIFQEPMSSLNPCFTVGFQLIEALKTHLDMDKAARRKRAIELLTMVGIPGARKPPLLLPAPAFGRHEPARDDRHGDRLQSQAADRRRADHRARCHHPGADPRSPAQAAARNRHGAGADHPFHGRRRRNGGARQRAICRPEGRGTARCANSSPIRTIPIPRPCSPPCPSAPMPAACLPFRASCRASSTARWAACFRRAAPMPPISAAPCRLSVMTARCAIIPCATACPTNHPGKADGRMSTVLDRPRSRPLLSRLARRLPRTCNPEGRSMARASRSSAARPWPWSANRAAASRPSPASSP